MSDVLNVCVTGAAGQIAYSLIYMVAKGQVFGEQKMNLFLLDIPPMMSVLEGVAMEIQDCAFSLLKRVVPTADPNEAFNLLDIPPMMSVLEGVAMEIQDCAFSLLKRVVPTADPNEAFKDCDAAFLVGAMPRREGMERKDLLKSNGKIFKAQGQCINQVAKKTIKVLVVGNPANTNALICSKNAPSIPKANFTAMTRLDQNRASAQIALRVGVLASDVKNVVVWGNHSGTQFPDAANATVAGKGSVYSAVNDDNWLKTDFIKTIQQRGAAVIQARKLSSAMSAAKAACDHMRDWFQGTKDGEFVSMAVHSADNTYGIDQDLMFSFPVTTANGEWKIVPGKSNEFTAEKLKITEKELQEEREQALADE